MRVQRSCTSSFILLRVALLVATAESGAHRALRAIVLRHLRPLSRAIIGGGWPVRAELGRLVDCNQVPGVLRCHEQLHTMTS